MLDRYYSAEPIQGATATLSGSEAHHLLHVMRAKPGWRLIVFDGYGGEYEAELTDCGRATVELSLGPRNNIERELPFQLTLAVALPKGDRQRWLVEKAVELGVARLVPLLAARTVAGSEQASPKLLRYVIEASKQCGRNRLMEVTPPLSFADLIESEQTSIRLLAHPDGLSLDVAEQVSAGNCSLAIGPEGGFTEEEIALAIAAGWQTVDLGSRILRIETAAIALASAIVLR
ncbi:MAG: 16S rRNA (uracil(1498)-N(3))-methyltransferase [Planctomycetales bacterium]|nr:16S rRNA (uracil(1498)-N(3))-methyltransferase [Planctomycetales bacterium]